MAKNFVRENVPLSRFGVLVAQLESIVASAAQQPPESVLCFDLLSDLISAIDEEPKDSILLWQRKCEDALYSLLILGAHRPVRHLASLAMARIISKGDGISIYSRASSLQGLLSDGKRSEPLRAAGAAQCLGELYRNFGRRITSGLLETTNIAAKLIRFNEDFVRQEALEMLQNALEGSGGTGAFAAYAEAFRLIMRIGVWDKSFIVRIAAARCLKTFASIGGPGLGVTELDNSATYCVKVLEDPMSSVRDAFSEALGALLALGMNPEAQVQPRRKTPATPTRKLDGCLQKHLTGPFVRANGVHAKDVRIGLTLSWVFFLQAIRLKYFHPDSDLSEFALQALDMLRGDSSVDAHALACVLYILRVGVVDQMTESTQRSFLVLLGRQLEFHDISPSMEVAVLRTCSYILKTLGEVPLEFKEVLDNTVVAALSHSAVLVRIEAALTLRALAEVDPTCVGGLISFAVTTINALRESVSFEKGSKLQLELDALHGQATILAALVSISPKLPLGYPAKLPKLVLDVSRKLLTEYSRNPVAATAKNEAGWLLLASLIASMPKEELEDQVFDILSLWASPFGGIQEYAAKQNEDLTSEIRVWSAAIEALTAFIRSFISQPLVASDNGVLLQPVLIYLGRALSYISLLTSKQPPNVKPALDLFVIRTLIAYQSLPDPMAYKNDHASIIQICTIPFREPSGCEESSCLRSLLDKRDAWLGPWIPGRDWFEDELRAFQGGKDGMMPCVWENELYTFPQPETTGKMLVNQMLLGYGMLFATQDRSGKLSLLGMIEQCLKVGKKQAWHAASVTNACVGLLAGLKAFVALRPQPLGADILGSAQAIFQGILGEGDICPAQRRASSEGLGLLARLGNDIFTARMTRSLLGDLIGATDLSYTASIAVSLGCIHRSAGGMALSTLVPTTVSGISSLAKSPTCGLQIWALHGLLLTIEAAGLTYVSQVQATLLLAMEILMSDETGWVELRQGIGRLINAIVAALGPELAPGSIFFSRCKSVVAEISSGQETSILLESVRFTQQLVLFAPQAVSMHSHVQTLLPTLASRQPALRHLAVSTLRHLIEKDPVAIIDEKIEENLFHMFDEETDSEIGNLVRATITRLLYTSCASCPSRWISICRTMVLAMPAMRNTRSDSDPVNCADGESSLYNGDNENMVTRHGGQKLGSASGLSRIDSKRDNHLRYRTRLFAAECLSDVPAAVGMNPAHFDLSLARKASSSGQAHGDWLVLHIQELIALAYQISTMQFESMQPIGVRLLSTIVEKFEKIPDPDLPGHFLMEQYQAQLISAIRTGLDTSSGPLLLEAGLHLATKILTSSITSGDQVAVKRIFSLILRPLNDFKDLYYPSFAEWVACKIEVRLLAAHATVKCYTYALLRRQHSKVRDEYLALMPQFSKASGRLGKHWMSILKDYSYICFCLQSNVNYKPFLDGIQSPLVSSKLQSCLEEAWPVILQAITLDAVPVKQKVGESSEETDENFVRNDLISGYRMVELESKEFRFLWGFALLVLFHGQHPVKRLQLLHENTKSSEDSKLEESNYQGLKFFDIALLVFHSLSTERFFSAGFLSVDISRELLQIFTYAFQTENSQMSLVVPVLLQIVKVSTDDFFEAEDFASIAMELCVVHIYKLFHSSNTSSQDDLSCEDLVSASVETAEILIHRFKSQMKLNTVIACLMTSYNCLRGASTDSGLLKVVSLVQSMGSLLRKHIKYAKLDADGFAQLKTVFEAWLFVIINLSQDCTKGIHMQENKKTNLCKLLQMKLAFCLEQAFSIAKLAHETQLLVENEDINKLLFSVYKCCCKCLQRTLTDSNMQVQISALQVLKSMAQKDLGDGSNVDNSPFFMFFVGELFEEVFNVVENALKKPMRKESATVVGECLRLLVLLHASSKEGKCQKGLLNLFLEAVIMVVSASSDDSSQEVLEIRSTAVRLVSHIAQMRSSAIHFKDVLLAMPVTQRQQLQDIIRASVAVDQKPVQTKAVASPLIIKLPQQTEHTKRDDPQVSEFTSSSKHSEKDEMEEEDDWDSFQSFSAATDTAAEADANSQGNRQNPEEQKAVDHPSLADENDFDDNDDFQEFSSSLPPENDKESYDSKFPEGGKENIGEEHDFSAAQVSESISKLSDDHLIESDGSDHKAFEANTTRSTLGNFSEDDEKETKETHKSGDHLEGSDISDDTVLEANIRCSTDDSSSDNSDKKPNKTLKSDQHLGGTDDSVHKVSEAKTRTSTNDSSSEDGEKKSDVTQNSSCVELHPEEVGDDEREILSRQEVVVVDDLQEFSEAQTLDAESDKGTTKQDLIESISSSSCSEENAGELT
ncbi:protein SWEETIE [Papaver somniferum]|uniref:protein SWEETIE n=1 Tax=Papaver somniferum TaxID=3469 RepID=UPI000E6F5B29|nr:protein SWEETIE [Papaver somniferum]